MRVLFISPVVPEPATDGGRQRIHHLLDALVAEHEVIFVGLSRGDAPGAWALAERFAAPPIFVDLGGRTTPRRGAEVARLLGMPAWALPDSVRRVERSGLWDRLQQLPLDTFDVVHVETMAMAPFALAAAARTRGAATVLDLPDVASHFSARLMNRHWWLNARGLRDAIDVGRLHYWEGRLMPGFDSVIVCSDVDRARLPRGVRPGSVSVVPNCTNTNLPPLPPATGSDLVFVGTMSYPPNEEGVLYFCSQVLPLVQRDVPGARFWIVGKSPSAKVQRLQEQNRGVYVTGEVDDVRPFLARSAAAVVPLLSGGGTRLKILEAMAAGRAVVSTTLGAEGLATVTGVHILLADTAQEMADSCVWLLQHPDRGIKLAEQARSLVEEHYDWRVARKHILSRYIELRPVTAS